MPVGVVLMEFCGCCCSSFVIAGIYCSLIFVAFNISLFMYGTIIVDIISPYRSVLPDPPNSIESVRVNNKSR